MRWFRDAFCQEEKKLADKLGVDAYELLEEQAKDVPVGSHGIIPTFFKRYELHFLASCRAFLFKFKFRR